MAGEFGRNHFGACHDIARQCVGDALQVEFSELGLCGVGQLPDLSLRGLYFIQYFFTGRQNDLACACKHHAILLPDEDLGMKKRFYLLQLVAKCRL